jgi:hypothetical protein
MEGDKKKYKNSKKENNDLNEIKKRANEDHRYVTAKDTIQIIPN